MVKEREPKRIREIAISSYTGYLADKLELNKEIAKGFMRVSDMRAGIVLIDESSNTKFANTKIMQPHYDGGIYYVAVSDQLLMTKAVEKASDTKGSIKKIETEIFKREFNKSLKDILADEKLFNRGKINDISLACYANIIFDFNVIPYYATDTILNSHTSEHAILGLALIPPVILGCNLITNWTNESIQTIKKSMGEQRELSPFVKDGMGKLGSPVPIDRWARGRLYLARHGGEMINNPINK